MVQTKKRFNKTDGILGFHAYQSFKEGEVTPEEAHRIGVELAKEMWGDRFQVLVCTHLNTNHYHNHFVINSVSYIDGKRYYDNRETYAEFRRLNDLICMENNLSYLQEKKTRKGINYVNYQNKGIKYSNYYKNAKEDLDIAISKSHTYHEFISIMNNMGYVVTNRADKLSIRGKEYKRNIRIERYYGEDYSIEKIKKQIAGLYLSTNKIYKKTKRNNNDLFRNLLKPKYHSLYGKYIRYCYLLQIYPNYSKNSYISPSMRNDVVKLDELSNQAKYLVSNNIETDDDFFKLLDTKEKELCSYKGEREKLWKKYKKVTEADKIKIKKKIDEINKKIKPLKEEIKICEKIRIRKDSINENLKNIEEKEMVINEHIK